MPDREFANYTILSELGVGSTARVYHARQENQDVALKVFFSQGAPARAMQLKRVFEQELDALRQLDHPNIVKLRDSGVHDGKPYLALELMPGGNLYRQLHQVDFLSIDDVLTMLQALASALDYAHSKNLLHRDIKPSNILYAEDGRPVLTDFGIAKFVKPREDATARADQMGTADFMAPEVLEDAPASVASDLYSLGVCVYFMLSNHLPSDGATTFSRCKNRVLGKLVPLSERNPLISPAVSDVVMRSIATSPQHRYALGQDFAKALMVAAAEPADVGKQVEDRPAGQVSGSGRLDVWRYVIVPIVVALLGLLGTLLVKLLR